MNNSKLRVTESNELLDAFISNTPFGVAVIDLTGKIKKVNKPAVQYLSLNLDMLNPHNANLLNLVEDVEPLYEVLKKSLKNGKQPFNLESLSINDSHFTISGQLILDGYIVTIEDISKQKEMEVNSIQAMLDGQENERRRIGRDIHDGIGPMLSYMKLSLDAFIDDLHTQNPAIPTDVLDTLSETMDSITSDLRLMSHTLVPRLLDEFGLSPAFENMVLRLSHSKKANISFYSNMEKDVRIDKDTELNLFRCGQELLNNAVKYAKASTIIVQLILHKDSIVLMVEDDGVGFKRQNLQLENFGIGLTNVDTRARMLNGIFNLDSVLDKGTVASVEIPIPN